MFKKKSLVALSVAAIALCGAVTACNAVSDDVYEDEMDFEEAEVEGTGFTMYIVGSGFADGTWTPSEAVANTKCAFTKASADEYVYNVEITAEADESGWGFKMVADGSWSQQYGLEDVDFDNCNDAFKEIVKANKGIEDYTAFKATYHEGTSNRSNISFCQTKDETDAYTHAGAGTYTIKYHPTNFESNEENSTTYLKKFTVDFTPLAA